MENPKPKYIKFSHTNRVSDMSSLNVQQISVLTANRLKQGIIQTNGQLSLIVGRHLATRLVLLLVYYVKLCRGNLNLKVQLRRTKFVIE